MLVIGAGRIGTSLEMRARSHDVPIELLGRTGGDFDGSGPILIATRNGDLPAVLERVPSQRHSDLVFLQNGWLGGWLREQGLQDCSRGLLYFAATERPGPIDPGRTSWFCGVHGEAVAAWFESLDLRAEAIPIEHFRKVELQKLAWLCVFGPLCQAHGATVSEVIQHHHDELGRLTAELAAFGAVVGIEVAVSDLLVGLVDYSLSIPDYRASVKEWEWRNGAVLDAMESAGVPSPLQRALTHPR